MVVVAPWSRKGGSQGRREVGSEAEVAELLPRRLYEGALERAKLKAGVVVELATEVVKRGLSVPALKEVTVPLVEVAQLGIPPARVRTWPFPPAVRLVRGSAYSAVDDGALGAREGS